MRKRHHEDLGRVVALRRPIGSACSKSRALPAGSESGRLFAGVLCERRASGGAARRPYPTPLAKLYGEEFR